MFIKVSLKSKKRKEIILEMRLNSKLNKPFFSFLGTLVHVQLSDYGKMFNKTTINNEPHAIP